MNLAQKVYEYENGLLEFDEMVLFFQYLIDSGKIHSFQGFYHRTASYLLEEGFIKLGNVLED
jgi:hypothetical protein